MTITVPIYILTATACAVANTFFGRRASKKVQQAQLDYEKGLRTNSKADAEAAYERLLEARTEMANEEMEAVKLLQQESHNELIKLIADESSRESWPLYVLPMVMRNDELLHSKTNGLSDYSPALNVIMAPFLEKGLQDAVYTDLQNSLLGYFNKWWTPMTGHPVVFYHNCWKDMKKSAEPIMVNNLYAKLKGTPTLVVNPVILEKGLRLDIYHWSLVSAVGEDDGKGNASKKLSMQITIDNLPVSVGRGLTYSDEEAQTLRSCLLKCLEIIISQYADCYMWHRAKVAPNIFNVIKAGGLKVENEEREWLHKAYADMLHGSIVSGEVILAQDTENVLAYCEQTDIVLEDSSEGAFKALLNALPNIDDSKKENNQDKTDIEKFVLLGRQQAKQCIDFCYEHKEILGLSDDEIKKAEYRWMEECLMDECISRLKTINIYHQPYTPDEAKSYVKTCMFGSDGKSKMYTQLLEDIQEFSKKVTSKYLEKAKYVMETDKRDYVRPKLYKEMCNWIENKIHDLIERCIQNRDVFVCNETHTFVEQVAKSVGEKFKLSKELPLEIKMRVYGTLKSSMLGKIFKLKYDYWKDKEEYSQDVIDCASRWANVTAKAWIEWNVFSPDKFWSDITLNEKNEIANYENMIVDELIKITALYAARTTGEQALHANDDYDYNAGEDWDVELARIHMYAL